MPESFSRGEVERMRAEMWSQFAPDTTIEEVCGDSHTKKGATDGS